MKICLIDNYDSFTFNLEHQLASFDISVDVIRNDETSIQELEEINYDAFVLGPGPSNPKNAGNVSGRLSEQKLSNANLSNMEKPLK